MTHSLHRLGPTRLFYEDYVWLVYHVKGINDVNLERKYREILDIARSLGSINYGDIKVGNIYTMSHEDIKRGITEKSRIRGVFTSKDQVIRFLETMKKKDYGLSVIITGLIDEVFDACKSVGLKPHSINLSLGVWGKKSLLPDESILAVTTMCGHHMISPSLVSEMIERIKRGETTPEEAAKYLARLCPCGIFNPTKAAKILEEISKQT